MNGGITGTANPGVYAGETAGTLVMQVPLADVATRRRGLPDQHAGRFPWDALRRGPHHLATGESYVLRPDERALGRYGDGKANSLAGQALLRRLLLN